MDRSLFSHVRLAIYSCMWFTWALGLGLFIAGFPLFSLFVTLPLGSLVPSSPRVLLLCLPCNRSNASEPSPPLSHSRFAFICPILILIHVAHCLYYMLAPNHSNHRFVRSFSELSS